ncbi:MAG: DEAD/DEAH box helicase family protein [Candidatus Lokiarchaeota archaeon]
MKPNLRDLFEDLDPSIKSLRSWQDKFSDYWTSYSNKRLIGLRTPTGSGKTLIGLLILEQGRRNKKRGVYLTHNYQLMDRIAKEADKLNINHAILGGAKNIKGIEWKNRQKKIYDYTNYNHIIISNYHTFLYTKDFPENIDILLIDDVDLFYDTLREYFSISIKNEGITKKCYSQIVESLSQRNYNNNYDDLKKFGI